MSFDEKSLEIPESLPMLPVRDLVVYPYMIIPLFVGRESSVRAVEEALTKNRFIFLASQKEMREENPSQDSIYTVGTVATIMRMRKLSDGRVKILIQGTAKAEVLSYVKSEPFFEVKVRKIEDIPVPANDLEFEALVSNTKEQIEKVIALGKMLSPDILLVLDDITEPGRLADLIASNLGLKVEEAQRVLETQNPKERLALVNNILTHEVSLLEAKMRIKKDSNSANGGREQFLRDQMKAIKNELGDQNDPKAEELEDLKDKIHKVGMPKSTEEEALKQLARLERMHPDASEASMVRTYLDWLTDLPWNVSTEDSIDLDLAQAILDEDHHELSRAKDRILEFLAVRKLKSSIKGPILCFVGPPGVGKTSLGKSVAKAMGRKYFRIALGGVKDEAEIRGHRRTYVGAMPGKIVQALKQIKSKNPVIVLDEVDKLGSDFRGDPSAAMLEVLDPEQNMTFRDNYLNVDFDLSNVLFLATANVLENVPAALRDRMEVIHISGYTENDKLNISKKHLVSRQAEANGVSLEQIKFTDEGLKSIISHYTREAGLRNLEREIGSVCRKVAKKLVKGEITQITITPEVVWDLLGAPRYLREETLKEPTVGIATGLAWTQAGGEVLFVESIRMKGKGGFKLTGQLGDVMKESAAAAFSYARAQAKELGIDENFFEENEVHIHLPAGAIPKDGPSAGVTLATALVSLMTGTPIRNDVAMTGEISLSGRVLPVGGIREKALAALTQGITNVIIPLANKRDLIDIPEEFKKQINFILVENLDEVFSVVYSEELRHTKKLSRPKKQKTHPAAA